MSISAISASSSLSFDNQSANTMSSSHKTAATASFSDILASLTGASSGQAGGAEATVTITKVLPDGSLVIVKMQGNQVISESKLSGASVQQQQNLLGLSAMLPQEYAAKDSAVSGSLFSASI